MQPDTYLYLSRNQGAAVEKCRQFDILCSYAWLLGVVVGLLAMVPALQAQPAPEAVAGLPFVQRWRPVDYDAHGQNWAFARDTSGVLYVGNTFGLLEYDGVTWQLHATPNTSVVRSLAVRADGTLFIGAQSELGYLGADSLGQGRFISLMHAVPERLRNCGVWKTFTVGNAVYFHTREALFRWHDGRMRVWEPAGSFHTAFLVDGQVYLRDTGVGLVRLEGDAIRPAPGGAALIDRLIYAMVPLSDGRILIAGGNDPLEMYDGATVQPFAAEAAPFVAEHFVYHGTQLADGRILLGSIGGGAVVFDPDGRGLRRLTTQEGIADNIVITTYQDDQGGVWMGHENGLSRVELASPFSYFDEAGTGLPGSQRALAWHEGELYAANAEGLFRQRAGVPGRPPVFEAVPGFSDFAYALLSVGDHLLVGTGEALYTYDQGRPHRVKPAYVFTLRPSRVDTARVFVGQQRGLSSVRWNGTRWEDEGLVPGIETEVRWIEETEEGALWIGTNYQGAWQITFADGDRQQPFVHRFEVADGLPGDDVKVFRAGGDVVFSAEGRFYRYEAERTPAFAPDPAFDVLEEAGVEGVVWAQEEAEGRLWIATARRVGYLNPGAAGYQWVDAPFRRLADFRFNQVQLGPDDALWIYAGDAIIRYDRARAAARRPAAFRTLLRAATTGADTLFLRAASPGLRMHPPRLPVHRSGLRFRYAAPRFELPEASTYQVRLDGFDDEWSPWTTATTKEYTSLSEGAYTFHVRGRDVYGVEAEEAAFGFVVLPPWYRTWWAYGFYLGLLGLGVYGLTQWRLRRLKAQTVALEALVQERTETIEAQAERLREMDRMKSRLFANISHEFRTPLTLTIGPLRDLQHEEALSERGVRQVDLALRNARRLLRLINQLLDITKIEAGRMEVCRTPGDIAESVRSLVQAFAALAERENVALSCESMSPSLPAVFDHDMLEKVVVNLLSNAFKFTPSGGAVRVRTAQDGSDAVLTVQDTGIGIAPDKLPHIFDRFYQVEDTTTRGYEGTGIGLSLVKELVELHGGSITVESTPDVGTTFTVYWPQCMDEWDAPLPGVEAASTESEVIHRSLAATYEDGAEAATNGLTDDADLSEDRTTVLVVDDHPEIRAYVREHLQAGYRVLEAADGAEGLERARAALPDLIISDVMMPRLDGYGFCAAAKSDPQLDCIPFILLTARAEGEDKLAGLGTGADDYVTKPFDVRELRLRVDNQIASRRRLRARLAAERSGFREVHMRAPEVASLDDALLEQARDVVEAHLDDEAFTVEALAAALGMSRSQFHRRIKELTGLPTGKFLRSLRLERAAQLLGARAGTVSEVAYAVGFQSLSHFSKCFRQQFGVLPSAYEAQAG